MIINNNEKENFKQNNKVANAVQKLFANQKGNIIKNKIGEIHCSNFRNRFTVYKYTGEKTARLNYSRELMLSHKKDGSGSFWETTGYPQQRLSYKDINDVIAAFKI